MSRLQILTTFLLAFSLAGAERVARSHISCVNCNNGTCVPIADTYRCLCPTESVGDYCQYTACNLDNFCMNSGTCQGGRCVCPDPYNGDKCEYKIYRKNWDNDIENDFAVEGNISIQMEGQENTPHNGQIVKGETFKLSLYGISLAYGRFEYCLRFLYKVADSRGILEVAQRRKEILPPQMRVEANSSYFKMDGQWHEMTLTLHGWSWSDLVISGDARNTAYIALDQVKVMRTDCPNIGI
ncbi:uncharacterized protein LOC128169163 [Crassostrea angulata]|uniref:uncharacterized protein LOC128169163 n=1 Tax=Magallana angulata TaxID=2784310 RepID=UPI0022B1095E|nr:uncharacterized protein LOC128169163 [Crassostrea angulata]